VARPLYGRPLRDRPLRGGPLRGGPLRGGVASRGGPLCGGPLRGGPLRGRATSWWGRGRAPPARKARVARPMDADTPPCASCPTAYERKARRPHREAAHREAAHAKRPPRSAPRAARSGLYRTAAPTAQRPHRAAAPTAQPPHREAPPAQRPLPRSGPYRAAAPPRSGPTAKRPHREAAHPEAAPTAQRPARRPTRAVALAAVGNVTGGGCPIPARSWAHSLPDSRGTAGCRVPPADSVHR
jgi:hypothetical protein